MTCLAFFLLAYALSWWPSLFSTGGLNPFGPVIAAVIVIAITTGRAGLKNWWHFITRWRGGVVWYALAILIPLAINFAAAACTVALGAPYPTHDQVSRWPELFVTFPFYLIALGPLGEEPGWRGFAMPALEQRHGRLSASLVLGVGVAVWHVPLVVGGQQPTVILLAVLVSQVFFSWLAEHVDGKVLIVMVAHAAQGGLGGEYFGTMFHGRDAVVETRLLTIGYCVVALIVAPLIRRSSPQHELLPAT